VLAAFFVRGLMLNPAYQESPLVCQPAPEFNLPDLADPSRRISNADFGGRTVLLNVWNSWCAPCREEHPFLLELARNGVPIFGLNWKEEEGPAAALAWLNAAGNPFVATAVDEIGDVAIAYGVYGYPETFLIDGEGTILVKHFGPLTAEIWQEKMAPAMEAQCTAD
jgi:cytochrome c biogenesis protein CcmG/thiol:disulfide interchange protein DsbE